jgi:hypothetical protein
MSRESKIFSESKALINKRVKEYEAFGWELLSINGTDVSLSRETQNKVYADLVKFEYNYEDVKEKQKALIKPIKPAKFKLMYAFLGLLCLVLPGVIYIVVKILTSNKYKNEALQYKSDYDKLEMEIKKICQDSRSTFFSRQQ